MAGQRLFCFAMERRAPSAPPENSRRPAIAAAPQPVPRIAPKEGRVARPARTDLPMPGSIMPIPSRTGSTTVESRPVGFVQLIGNPLPKHRRSLLAQVVVEIAQCRDEREKFDPCCLCPLGQD